MFMFQFKNYVTKIRVKIAQPKSSSVITEMKSKWKRNNLRFLYYIFQYSSTVIIT